MRKQRAKSKIVKDSPVPTKPRDYVNKFRLFIKRTVEGTSLLPSIVMAHVMYTSTDDFKSPGNSVHARDYHNQPRLPADSTWKGRRVKLPLHCTPDSKLRHKKAWFRIYKSPETSISDFVQDLLTRVQAWPKLFWYEDTIRAQATLLQTSLNLPDQKYNERLVHIIKKNKLHWMDRQWMVEKACRMVVRIILFWSFGYVLHNYWDVVVGWR